VPPSRRRPGASSASRRPRVAGQRQRPHDQENDAPQQGAEHEDAAAPATDEGVARPVIGEDERPAETSAGAADPESATEATAEMRAVSTDPSSGSDDEAEPAAVGGLFSRDFALPITLVVLAAVLAGFAVWFGGEASALSSGGDAENRALSDAAGTSEVNGQVSSAVEKVFSYSFADTASTENAAKQLLSGKAADQYNQLFSQIKQQAPAQKLVVTVKVVTSGVKMLQGDRAQVLLFLDQTATRTDANQTNSGAAQLTVNAEKHGGNWVITDLNMR
jgi:Mce-associated membrane protein